jgi:alpha-L-fucosidase
MTNQQSDKLKRFSQHRFGMFVHWGLYAINGWHEQEMWRRRVSREEYIPLIDKWNPVNFNPDAWLDLAQEAGMEYLVFTTKHHDGFCLFNTRYTDFNVMNSPYHRDILGELAVACQRRNFPLGIYYSVVDWMQPNYPNQGRHHEIPAQPGDDPDMKKYMEFLRSQVRELCTGYGKLHSFWWDMNVDGYHDPTINQMIRELQPDCFINNRGMDEGDFGTPERDWNDHAGASGVPVEACQSVGMESWGYRVDESYYSDRHIIRSMDRFLAKGANYLLNVGPQSDGIIPEKSAAMLRRIGNWYKNVRKSFENVETLGEVTGVPGSILTRKENKIYLHLPADFPGEDVIIKPLQQLPKQAVLLNTGQKLRCANNMTPSQHSEQTGYLRICGLPINEMSNTCMVIELEFETMPEWQTGDDGKKVSDVNIM